MMEMICKIMYNHGDTEVIKWTEEFYQECCLLWN